MNRPEDTRFDRQLNDAPMKEQAAHWLEVLRDEPQRHAEFTRWLNQSASHATEFLLAKEVDDQLQRFCRADRIDVDKLVARARQEHRLTRLRARFVRVVVSVAALSLLIAALRRLLATV